MDWTGFFFKITHLFRGSRYASSIALSVLITMAMVFPRAIFSDTLTLKNGERIQGTIIKQSQSQVTIKLDSGATRVVEKRDVLSLQYSLSETDESEQKEARKKAEQERHRKIELERARKAQVREQERKNREKELRLERQRKEKNQEQQKERSSPGQNSGVKAAPDKSEEEGRHGRQVISHRKKSGAIYPGENVELLENSIRRKMEFAFAFSGGTISTPASGFLSQYLGLTQFVDYGSATSLSDNVQKRTGSGYSLYLNFFYDRWSASISANSMGFSGTGHVTSVAASPGSNGAINYLSLGADTVDSFVENRAQVGPGFSPILNSVVEVRFTLGGFYYTDKASFSDEGYIYTAVDSSGTVLASPTWILRSDAGQSYNGNLGGVNPSLLFHISWPYEVEHSIRLNYYAGRGQYALSMGAINLIASTGEVLLVPRDMKGKFRMTGYGVAFSSRISLPGGSFLEPTMEYVHTDWSMQDMEYNSLIQLSNSTGVTINSTAFLKYNTLGSSSLWRDAMKAQGDMWSVRLMYGLRWSVHYEKEPDTKKSDSIERVSR